MFICVRHLLTAMCLFAIGCYETPDYAATSFKCDTAHACPDGQTCVNGACSGGGSAVGVACGSIICAANQQCCLNFLDVPSCVALVASCDGLSATCDGIEDCGGNACCAGIDLAIACRSTPQCLIQDTDQICRDASDCTDPAAKQCCFGSGLPGEPWGRCGSSCSP